MSFNPDTHNTISMNIEKVRTELSIWIRDYKNAALNEGIASILTMDLSPFHVHLNITEHNANILIEALHQHIANIKAAEIELLALSAKAAA